MITTWRPVVALLRLGTAVIQCQICYPSVINSVSRLSNDKLLDFGVDYVLPNVVDCCVRSDWNSAKGSVSTSTNPNAR